MNSKAVINSGSKTQNYWGSGVCPSSRVIENNVSETVSGSVLRWWEGDTYSVGSLRKT
jgi:hypothetical protein